MRLEILLIVTIGLVIVTEAGNNDESKTFIPTREWQTINEGQAIPAGLHVRINLETGKKEAKLIDPDGSVEEQGSIVAIAPLSKDDTPQDHPQDHTATSHSRHKEALKNIPDEGFHYSEEKLKEITKKFKSYEKMKQELADMDMNIKTDFQLMSDLFRKYEKMRTSNDISLDEMTPLFDDLEYLLHQIDNANDFVTSGGIEKIIIPNIGNHSIPELRIYSCKLLGVLMQNNPKGQIAAFEKNVGSFLLHWLSQSSTNNTNELSSIIFAFGGLLRKFPLAQEELLNNPGLQIVVDLLGKHVDYKIKIKCLLLISDLIREYNEVNDMHGNDDVNKTQQYNVTDIKSRLEKTDFCTTMDDLFSIHRQEYLDSFYATDDILNVLIATKEMCQPVWGDSPIFRHTLLVIKSNYEQIGSHTSPVEIELKETINKLELLNEFLYDHIVIKDEL